MEIEKQVYADAVGIINERFGDDLSNLDGLETFINTTEKTRKELEKKLWMTSEETDKGIIHVLQESKKMANQTKALANALSACREDIERYVNGSLQTRNLFRHKVQQVQSVSKLVKYLLWISLIEEISQKIGEEVLQDGQQDATANFQHLLVLWKRLRGSSCSHLLEYLKTSLLYWFDIFKQHLGAELDRLLETCHWPVTVPSSIPASEPASDTLTKLAEVFELLLKIGLPEELQEPRVDVRQLPLRLMFLPFRKRFLFHFTKSHKTNRIDKPEWYLTQILTWIRDNTPFLQKFIQPIVDSSPECSQTNAHVELMRSLVQLACSKLEADRDLFLYDDALVTHHVDEILLFAKELQSWGYTLPSPNVLNVLTAEPLFSKWLALESKFAEERMDEIFNGEHAWACRYPCSDDVDELKVPEFAESFMILLLSMTERYQLLPWSEHQMQFLELELKLLDDFRLRLQQLRCTETGDPVNPRVCSILNAVSYVALVLNEWSNLPFFIKLHRDSCCPPDGKDQLSEGDVMAGSVFQKMVSLLEHMQSHLLETLKRNILCEVKAKSRSYRSEKWFCMAVSRVCELTGSAFVMLSVLRDSLRRTSELVSQPLFLFLAAQLAADINTYMLEEVILQNLFSEGGALQLQKDVNRNLVPIFGTYLQRPDGPFCEVKEACVLLTLARGSAILLKETVQGTSDATEALQEQGVHRLGAAAALQVLKRRTDM